MRTVSTTTARWVRPGLGLVMLAVWVASAGAETLLHLEYADNGGTKVTDLSGNDQNATLVGFLDTAPSAGQFNVSEGWVDGGGVSFLDDADRSYVETPLPLNALENKDFTVE